MVHGGVGAPGEQEVEALKEMRKTLEPGTLFGEDSGDVYGGMFDLYLGQQMTQSGGFGLAKMIRESLDPKQKVNTAG